jgi:predicted small secreted protein
MRRIFVCMLAVLYCFTLAGCGETVSGVTKDTQRITKGVKTVFFRD